MKNKLFYLIGVASILCYTSTFTSCINGVDDEYLELTGSCNGGGTGNEDEDSENFDGEYITDGDYDLKMTYNGYELNGKKVAFTLNEDKESATITMTGAEFDLKSLAALFEGMDGKFTTYSPIPGEKEILLKNVKAEITGSTCKFEGEDIRPDRIFNFKGEITDGKMNIDIQHKLARENNELLGKWKMGEAKEGLSITMIQNVNNSNNDPSKSSPLWLDWGSTANVNMGDVNTGIDIVKTVNVNRPMTGIFNLLMSNLVSPQIGTLIGMPDGVEKSIPKLIGFIATEETGGMYASYSWNGTTDPQYSQDMSHNIVRYYYDKEDQLRIEVDADFFLNTIGGLIAGTSTRATTRGALPGTAIAIGQKIIDRLRPALEQGFPCEYTIENNNLIINLDGQFLLEIMRLVDELVNDEFAKTYIDDEIDKIGDYAPNVKLLLQNMGNALGEDCTGIKLGLRLVKMEETPEVVE